MGRNITGCHICRADLSLPLPQHFAAQADVGSSSDYGLFLLCPGPRDPQGFTDRNTFWAEPGVLPLAAPRRVEMLPGEVDGEHQRWEQHR